MKEIKKIINIITAIYLVFALLVVFDIMGVTYFDANFTRFNPENFYYIVFIIGTFLLLLEFVTDLLYSAALKRERAQDHAKINKLKAEIYDLKLEQSREERSDIRITTEPLPPVPAPAPDHKFPPADQNPTITP